MCGSWKFLGMLMCAAMVAISSVAVIACGDDDDDDDDDDGAGVECTSENLCQWAISACGEYGDMATCLSQTDGCADAATAIDCLCGCMNADIGCEQDATGTCASECYVKHC